MVFPLPGKVLFVYLSYYPPISKNVLRQTMHIQYLLMDCTYVFVDGIYCYIVSTVYILHYVRRYDLLYVHICFLQWRCHTARRMKG